LLYVGLYLAGFFVKFSQASGGLIVDCGIHDIDMARWLFGLTTAVTTSSSNTSDSDDVPRVKRVFSTGLSVRHPELAKTDDADNAICVVEFTGGKVLDFHLSRTGLHGHDCFTEVFGSERKVIVNGVSVGAKKKMNRCRVRLMRLN
jgi:myo-inositol 2-dehydrogenase/D-chiro-inositol 1-dehydrogenase